MYWHELSDYEDVKIRACDPFKEQSDLQKLREFRFAGAVRIRPGLAEGADVEAQPLQLGDDQKVKVDCVCADLDIQSPGDVSGGGSSRTELLTAIVTDEVVVDVPDQHSATDVVVEETSALISDSPACYVNYPATDAYMDILGNIQESAAQHNEVLDYYRKQLAAAHDRLELLGKRLEAFEALLT